MYRSSPRPPRRRPPAGRARRRTALALTALLSLACGPDDSPSKKTDAGEPVVRLGEVLDQAEYLAPEAPGLRPGAQTRTLFDSATALPADGDPHAGWHPMVRLRRAPTEAETDAFEASSRVEADGTVAVGPCLGFWFRPVAVQGGTTIALRGTLEVESLSGEVEEAFAQVGLAELSGEVEGVAPEVLAQRVELYHTTPEFGAPSGRRPFALLVTLAPETTHVGLTLAHRVDDDGAAAGGVRFRDVRVARPGPYAYAAAAAARPELAFQDAGGARGGYTLGRVLRDGIALPSGAGLRWGLALPDDAERFEAFVGLVPHDDFPNGERVRFRATWSTPGRGSDEPLATFESACTNAPVEDSRWSRIGGPLPAELRGRVAVLELHAEPEAAPAGSDAEVDAETAEARPRALPVFGSPRIVPAQPARVGPNIVIVSLDTLRADHVGAYGYERPTTPHLDELARESVLFEDVWAQGPYTLPSHMSLLSGQHPSVHGVQRDADARDPVRTPLLAEILGRAGWTTAAFTGGGYVHPVFGFDGGFELFSSLELVWNRESARIRRVLNELPDVSVELAESHSLADVTDWIEAHREESFFLFFHTYAAHEFDPPARHLRALGADETGLSDDLTSLQHLRLAPGDPERPIPPADVARLVDLYDGGVRQADEAVGTLVEALRANDLWDDTIFVVVSDHGQEIGEHGEVGHGHTLYEEMLKIPLLLRIPGAEPGRVTTPAMLVDVVPTLLAELGLKSHEVQGHDLRALPTERALFAEVDNAAVKQALREGTLKTIHGPPIEGLFFPNEREEESYDLAADPSESSPLPVDPARLEPLLEHVSTLRRLAAALAGGRVQGSRVDPALRAQLDALGYEEGR